MRKAISQQKRLDCLAINDVQLNLECRDEIIPILAALQHVYSNPELRDSILQLVGQDVNADARDDCGRQGLHYWQILVLAAVRIGCDLDYDKLQDLAEQHRALRHMMGIGDWDEDTSFNWRRIRDNVCLLRPATIEKISHLIVATGHELDPQAAQTSRADSFVVETNIHYPSESALILDGVRVILQLCVMLATIYGFSGWRQHEHLYKRAKQLARRIARISSRKGPHYQRRLKKAYRALLKFSGKIVRRAQTLCDELPLQALSPMEQARLERLQTFIERTQQVRETARRRVLRGERVPNEDKLFSLFEPHTQLYKRGKAGQPVQFGRMVMIYEDGAGFITHHHLLDREEGDKDVVVKQTRTVQTRLGEQIEAASFDRGYHSPENQEALAEIVPHLCLPKPGVKQAASQAASAGVRFHQSRQRHSGVESAIGALQRGNGLKRCRDRSELGLERYVALAVLGRNLQTLGKLLIRQRATESEAAYSKRQAS